MTSYASREMVFNHDLRQIEEQRRSRSGIDAKKVQELHDAIREGTVDVGPIVQHSPIDPKLRPNPPDVVMREQLARSLPPTLTAMQQAVNDQLKATGVEPPTNGWNPH